LNPPRTLALSLILLVIIGSQAVAADTKRRRNHTVRHVELVAVAAASKMSENIHRSTLPKFKYF